MPYPALLAASLTLAACGRLGFDATGTDDARPGSSDALLADAPDATAAPPIAFAQTAAADFGAQASGGIRLTQSVRAGDTIIIAVDFDLGGTPDPMLVVVTDSVGTSYTITSAFEGSGIRAYLAYGRVAADGTNTVQLVSSGTHQLFEARIHEYSGIAALGSLDGVTAASGSAMEVDAAATPPLSVPVAGELLFGFILFLPTGVAGTGFAMRSAAFGDITEDLVTTRAGIYSATGTQTVGAGWLALVAAFHPAAP